jgi:hypothetical protein
MRFRLGGWAVAGVLVLAGCGVDEPAEHASPDPGIEDDAALGDPELVSARDTLPPAPPSGTALTVLLTHAGGAADAGLDAAAGALAQRPDLRVVVVVSGAPGGAATTMSGFPVTIVDAPADGLVAGAIAATGVTPDIVFVGFDGASALGGPEEIAGAVAAGGTPALVVEAEAAETVDHAAAAMQLLEVLDLQLDALLDEPAAVHRLTVPSCWTGTLRGRLDVRPTATAAPLPASDCGSADRTVPGDELEAVGAGYAALARLP